jgi:glycosyltransferase involved in cell wall biosynthesis
MTELLLLTEEFYPSTSGGAHIRWQFSQIAADRGHDITVFTPREEGMSHREQVEGVDIRRPFRANPSWIPVYSALAFPIRILYTIVLAGYLLVWLRGRDLDGVHSASHSMHWVGTVLSVVYGIPLVTFVGYSPTVTPTEGFSAKAILERINFRWFMGDVAFCRTPRVRDAIDALSSATVRILHGALTEEKIRTAAEETNPEVIRERYEIADDEKFLVYVGRFVPIKNVSGAVDILASLPETYKLVIIGDGPEFDSVEQQTRQLETADRVVLTGKLPHDETLRTIAAAEALLLTSEADAYPTVVFEALSLCVTVFAPPLGILTKLEHRSLYLGTPTELTEIITDVDLNSGGKVDNKILDNYSMERYTDEVQSTFGGETKAP